MDTLTGGTRYYFSPLGNDGRDGRSPTTAWKSLSKIASLSLKPGDRIQLLAGVHHGSIVLPTGTRGTPAQPIIIEGIGVATIESPGDPSISSSEGGLEIRNLILKGNATKEIKNYSGVKLWAVAKDGSRQEHIRIEHIDVSGFMNGIEIGSIDPSHSGFKDVRISHVFAHGNYGAGIASWDLADGRGLSHKGLRISDCDVSQNLGGSGMVISGFEGGVIEFCSGSANTGKGGGVGIWAYCAKDLVFRHCIASGTRSGGGDGGGFDLDGGCVDCRIEDCLAFENDGPGYMHCDYPGAPATRKNVIRNCVSVNDGRKEKGDSMGFGFVTWGSGLDDCVIAHNVGFVSEDDPAARQNAMLFVSYLPGSAQNEDKLHVRGCRFEENRILVAAKGVAFYRSSLPDSAIENVVLTNNAFRYSTPESPRFVAGDAGATSFGSLKEWEASVPVGGPNYVQEGVPGFSSDYRNLRPRDLPQFFKTLPWTH